MTINAKQLLMRKIIASFDGRLAIQKAAAKQKPTFVWRGRTYPLEYRPVEEGAKELTPVQLPGDIEKELAAHSEEDAAADLALVKQVKAHFAQAKPQTIDEYFNPPATAF
jgi:hypothetical protein